MKGQRKILMISDHSDPLASLGGEEALAAVRERGSADRLYIARGDFLGMNGNYSAGVLEGVAHFFPETLPWME